MKTTKKMTSLSKKVQAERDCGEAAGPYEPNVELYELDSPSSLP